MKMKKIIFAVMLTLLMALPAGSASAQGPLQPLDKAGLADLVRASKGKAVMLNFFATWCPPCRQEIPSIVKMSKKYAGKVVFVGIAVDDAKTAPQVLPFAKKMGMNYPVYAVTGDIVQAFSVSSVPFNVFYDRMGKVQLAGSGVLEDEDFEQVLDGLLK